MLVEITLKCMNLFLFSRLSQYMPTSTRASAAATENKKKASTKVIIKNFLSSIDILFQDENFTVELLADDPAELTLFKFGFIW